MRENAEDLVHDRWPEFLMARGMDSGYFSGRHCSCPICGGSDRFRFVAKKGGGLFVCNHCTGGKYASPFKLLMEHMGYRTFMEAANDVRDYFNTNHIQAVPRPMRLAVDGLSEEESAKNRSKMLKLWEEAKPVVDGDPVSLYIQNRVPGLDKPIFEIRYHPSLEYWTAPEKFGGQFKLLGKFPGMLAKAVDSRGELGQVHRTFLTHDGQKANVPDAKKTMASIGRSAFAVRLMPVEGDTLGVCEGIETALAASMLYPETPVWSCLNGGTLSRFVLPDELRGQVKRLIIYADSDFAKDRHGKMVKAGSQYASELATSARKQGLRSLIIRPAGAGLDFADLWQRQVELTV